jgi:hypothetical protein
MHSSGSGHLTMLPKTSSLSSNSRGKQILSSSLPHCTIHIFFPLFSSPGYWQLLHFSLSFSLLLRDRQWRWRHASEPGPCTRPRPEAGSGLAAAATLRPGQGPPPLPSSRRPRRRSPWWRRGGRLASSASARTSSTKVPHCPYQSC